MPSIFEQWLDVSIEFLQQQRQSGRRFIHVTPATLEALKQLQPAARNVPARPSESQPGPSARIIKTSPPGSVSARIDPAGPANPPLDPPPTRPVGNAGPAAEILTGPAKVAAFDELRQRASVCTKCPPLASARQSVVFGVGNIDAEIMFVGEAPGADEDAAGEPFVGKAGQLLTRIIETMGLARGGVYIANILKCRPDTPGQKAGNRKPSPEEMRTCSPYLHAQIDLIRPKVIIALGVTAVEGLLGRVVSINRLRGQWQTYRGIAMMPTFHPAYLLRNQAISEKRKIWEDMLQVMDRLQMTVTPRQRNFFLES